MTKQEKILKALEKQKILPAFFQEEHTLCIEVLQVLYNSGIRVAIFTISGEEDLANFKALLMVCGERMPDMYLGAGNIRSSHIAHAAIDADADFLISPVFDAGVCDVAYLHKILWIPGCMTPAEIHEADKAGCHIIQLFPANIINPQFLGSVKGIFPRLSFIPFGEISTDPDALLPWLQAGAIAVGLGGQFITDAILENNQLMGLSKTMKVLLERVAFI